MMKTLHVLVLFLFFSYSTSQVAPTQLVALIDFYQNLNGPNWITSWPINSNGNATSDPCLAGWYGIKCNGPNVYSLVLQANALRGTIPPSISALHGLQFLYLSKNSITGTIPYSLGTLSGLQQLGLDSNFINGTIPTSFLNLDILQSLFLQDNQLSGSLNSLTGIRRIQYLYLSRNRLTGTIPDAIGNFYLLQQIGVDSNLLTGSIPTGFGRAQNYLQSFYAQNNDLTGSLPASLCSVQTCDASGNEFTCPLPNHGCCLVTSCFGPTPTTPNFPTSSPSLFPTTPNPPTARLNVK
eukprot:TRINITY_DN5370_c0_g1_i1.p1 TRINITY_DN5370_c0_g1~~TRINITY_DN5370_c0_g1_i1.p1  ORF type:complete len:295 (+),score=43.24 TRINITY_DN5370_c0_g1_i1:115-999(+)